MSQPQTARSSGSKLRIPHTLQAVFLASNRGRNVNKPPPENVASKVFFRNWFFQKQSSLKCRKGGFWSNRKEASEAEESKGHPLPVLPTPSPRVRTPVMPMPSPHVYLDAMIRSRGYSTKRFKTLQSAYYNKPTALQKASHDVHVINLVRSKSYDEMNQILQAGISPNPCNTHGESLLHMLCRRGDAEMLKVMIRNGASVQVSDDYGRTPLHDACWAATPAFQVIDLILKLDNRLFHMLDSRGSLPLSYVRQEHASMWMEFLDSRKDLYWPKRDVAVHGEQRPPALTMLQPNSRPLPDPFNALTPELAKLVASGKMSPKHVNLLKYEKESEVTHETDECSFSSDDEYTSDSNDDSCDWSSSYDSDFDDDSSFNEDEMQEIIANLSRAHKPVAWTNAPKN